MFHAYVNFNEALCHGKEAICLIPEMKNLIFFLNKKFTLFKDVSESESISSKKYKI